jgi:hypothetical protein
MKADLDDHPRFNHQRKTVKVPYVLIGLSAVVLMGFAYLHTIGWGITVDVRKLAGSVTVNGKPPEPTIILPPNIISDETPTRQINKPRSSSDTGFITPSGMLPLSYELQHKLFETIFIHHASCAPNEMKWTQMECSNFKARAMKRFGIEWSKSSYWDGNKIKTNKNADQRVNAELSL